MRLVIETGNIADEPADVLVCSANPHLTLSGGVDADLLTRHGPAMQSALERIVRQRTPHFIPQGEVVPYSDAKLPYRAVLHAVAIDGWYESSPQIVERTVTTALRMAAELGARRVALAALATGFGHLSLAEFAAGIRPLLVQEFPPVDEVCIRLLEDYRVRELAEHLTTEYPDHTEARLLSLFQTVGVALPTRRTPLSFRRSFAGGATFRRLGVVGGWCGEPGTKFPRGTTDQRR